MTSRARAASVLAAAVLALCAACGTPPTPADRLAEEVGWVGAKPAAPDDAKRMLAWSKRALTTTDWSLDLTVGGESNTVHVTRFTDGVQIRLDGWRLGRAGQIQVGRPGDTDVALVWDDGTRQLCSGRDCSPLVSQTDQSGQARLVDAVDVLTSLAPLTPQWRQAVASRLQAKDAGELYSGTRSTAAGDAWCLAWVRPAAVEPLACVLAEGWGQGIPVPTGWLNDMALAVDVTGARPGGSVF